MLPEQAHIAWARLQEDLALAATLGVKQLPIDHIQKRMKDLEAGLPLQTSFISEGTGQARSPADVTAADIDPSDRNNEYVPGVNGQQ